MLAVMDDPPGRTTWAAWPTASSAASRPVPGTPPPANLWGAWRWKNSAKFEATPNHGHHQATMGGNNASVDWSKVEAKTTDASGAAHQTTWFGAPAAPGNLKNNSMFLPWGKAGSSKAAKRRWR